MKKSRIPTVIGVFTLVIGVAVGVFAVNQTQSFRLGASPETTPQDVQISNIQDKSATITWKTDKAVVGSIVWDETANVSKAAADGTSLKNLHSVNLTGLTPGKRYYFKIISSNATYSNSGSPWTFDTQAKVPTKTQVLTGSILTATGQPAANAQVFVSSANMALLSGTTTDSGNWTVTAPIASDALLKETIDIFVQGGTEGIASAQINFKDAQNTPPITMGKTHDFRGTAAINNSNQPESSLSLPVTQTTSKQSGFAVEETKTTKSTTVDLKSIKDKEQVFTKKPEFFGDGTPGTSITITVHSTAVATQTLKIPSSGSWRWSPSTQLEEGAHTITITWKDAAGILRTLTRNFTVSAADNTSLAFESTPSGSTATPKATKTPTPTVEPTSTPSATPVATKTPRPTATPASTSALPEAGVAENTYILLAAGFALIAASFIIFKKA